MSQSKSSISFPVDVARLPQRGMTLTIDADADQREALAAAHELLEVIGLRAELVVTPWKKGGVRIAGRLRARIVQACIVSLEPVAAVVEEDVSALFLPEGSKLALPARSVDGEILLDAEGDDAPETFSGDLIDVGSLVEEFFELGIDPYPRKSGVALEVKAGLAEERSGPLHEKLQALRKKL